MTAISWSPGAPTITGIYWWDGGFNNHYLKTINLILQVRPQSAYVFGDNNMMALSSVYMPSMSRKARHSLIALPEEDQWGELTSALDFTSGESLRLWLKSPEGYIGLGMLKRENNELRGQIAWLTHPNCASHSGITLKSTDEYSYYKLSFPSP